MSIRRTSYLWALNDVSFEVGEGEVVGIIGRNGAGKSTLLKLLSRITYATSGVIHVGGRVASLLEVGTGFHDELTGRENIYLNGSILGMHRKEIKQRLDEIVAFSGIDRLIDTPIKRYSSGMRLRLGFAVAAHLSPDILLVDEVLAVGDADFQKKCLDAMDDLRSERANGPLRVAQHGGRGEPLLALHLDRGGAQSRQMARRAPSLASTCGRSHRRRTGKIDLESVETRTGNGEGRFTHFEFLNPAGRDHECHPQW